MLGIRPCCLSHDYICPMTIWVFYQKKPLSPVIDRESRRGNASFRGLELLYLHIFRARFAQPSPWHSSQHLQGGKKKPTMSCALHARSRNVPELCMGSSLKRRGKKRPYLLSYLIIPGGSSQLLPIWSIWLDWIHMFTGKKKAARPCSNMPTPPPTHWRLWGSERNCSLIYPNMIWLLTDYGTITAFLKDLGDPVRWLAEIYGYNIPVTLLIWS